MRGDPTSKEVTTYVLVDNRNRSSNESPFDFRVSLSSASTPFQLISSIRLVQMQVAKMKGEDFFVISVEPIDGRVQCTGNGGSDAFAVCIYSNTDYLSLNVLCGDNITGETTFDPPLARLDYLRIRLKKYDGSVLTQDDVTNSDGTFNDRVMMTFSIVHKNSNVP